MSRYPGGLIRKTPVTPAGPFQNGAAPGVWTLAEASYWTKQGLWPTAGNFLAVEDVFSCFLYTGNGNTQTITNGIDLAGKGGLVWAKPRITANSHILTDTARGVANTLSTNINGAQNALETNSLNSFNSNGFTLNNSIRINASGEPTVSWTFRKAPDFFDVVTYTGNGGSSQTIAHNLGVAPGCVIIKPVSASGDWIFSSRETASTYNYGLFLNTSGARAGTWDPVGTGDFNSTTFDTFIGNTAGVTNTNGTQYVAYLFAHDPSADGIIQCGSFTTDGSGVATVTLGYEPQWVLFKSSSASDNWRIVDNMRGFANAGSSSDARLFPNLNSQEFFSDTANPTATGFVTQGDLQASQTYIYVAIRRGPMRTPTLGTSVFSPQAVTLNSGTVVSSDAAGPMDVVINQQRSASGGGGLTQSRLTGDSYLNTSSTGAENSSGSYTNWDRMTGTKPIPWTNGQPVAAWQFRRAPGFMDVVCWTCASSPQTIPHNLGVVPDLIITKQRNGGSSWFTASQFGGANYLRGALQTTGAFTTQSYGTGEINSAPTASNFAAVNFSTSNTYVSYLFASVSGVSKVGSYTGNGSSQTINCAFTTGARFVMIKRTDSTGDWYVWDSARGIVAGNDPYLALNTTAVEVTSDDSVDTDSTGFVVNQVAASNINVNAATYIFLAIA